MARACAGAVVTSPGTEKRAKVHSRYLLTKTTSSCWHHPVLPSNATGCEIALRYRYIDGKWPEMLVEDDQQIRRVDLAYKSPFDILITSHGHGRLFLNRACVLIGVVRFTPVKRRLYSVAEDLRCARIDLVERVRSCLILAVVVLIESGWRQPPTTDALHVDGQERHSQPLTGSFRRVDAISQSTYFRALVHSPISTIVTVVFARYLSRILRMTYSVSSELIEVQSSSVTPTSLRGEDLPRITSTKFFTAVEFIFMV